MRVSGFVTKQDLMEPPGAAPPPSPLLWLLSAEYSLGRCTDAKATSRWTPFNYVPQTYGNLRTDGVNTCSTTLWPHHPHIIELVHELITYPATSLPRLAFKNALLKHLGESEFASCSCPGFLAWCPAVKTVLSSLQPGVSVRLDCM